jgi:hypothetical protein
MAVVNGSTTSVPLSSITARYYYTNEFPGMTPIFTSDWAKITTPGMSDNNLAAADVSYTIGTISPAVTDANAYIEFSFAGASTLNPGQAFVFYWTLSTANPASEQWTETNDYSFNAADNAGLTTWDHIVVLVSGSVAYGIVPM